MRKRETANDYTYLNSGIIVEYIMDYISLLYEKQQSAIYEDMSRKKLKRIAAALNNALKEIEE